MEVYQGVAITDGLNRKNHFMLLSTILKAYRDAWDRPIPMNIGHDRTKPIGYTKLTGVYMEPGKAYVTNESAIMETSEEHEILRKMIELNDHHQFCEEHKDEIDSLVEKLKGTITDSFRVAPVGQAVAIKDNGIVRRLFPEWTETFKDGLTDIKELKPIYSTTTDGKKGVLIPGVYLKDGYLLFAHQFFRRTLSILNSTNEEFFVSFEKLREIPNLNVKVALDMDMVGLPGTEHPELEYQYIRGPHFNEDLKSIPDGVTCHENEHYDNLFSNIVGTQFYWHKQDGTRTFECEELCDKENVSFDGRDTMLWGCRYVHSMLNPGSGLPTHLDGAIRLYDEEQILERLDKKTDISKCGKNSEYVKLWRIDNEFSILLWKELISNFYRENPLIGEYFGGVDKKYEQIKKESVQRNSVAEKTNKFIPVEINKGDGLRLFFRYSSKILIAENYDVRIVNKNELICSGKKKVKILEADSITFFKLLMRKGIKLRMPFSAMIEFGDTVTNFPTICCRDFKTIYTVLEAILDLCNAWDMKGDNRLLSVGIMLNEENNAVQLSFAGHVSDFVTVLKPSLSDRTDSFDDLVENVYIANNRFGDAGDRPDKFTLIHGDVVCFNRYVVPPKYISGTRWEGKTEIAELSIPEEEASYLKENKVICAPIKWVKNSKCTKCGADYFSCSCVKFIDEDVSENHIECKQIGITWTNRSAYYPEGEFSFINSSWK